MTKQIALIGTAVMTTLLALAALWQFRIVVLCVLISLVLAAMFRPISRSESRRNVLTRLLLISQYVIGIAVVVILIFLVGRFLVGDFQQLAESLSEQRDWMLPSIREGGFIQQVLVRWLPTPEMLFNAITSQREIVLSTILGITQGVGGVISGFLIILFLSIYWSINQNHFERLWLSLLPAEQRKQARYVWRSVERDLGSYTRSEILQSVLAGLLLGIGYWLLGSPYPMLLAVTGAIAWLVPVVGAAFAVILPFLLGILSSTQLGIFSVLYTLAVLLVLQVWVEPRLFKLKLDNPMLTFVILLAMADAFGLIGIIAAPPISVICQVLWRLLVTNRLPSDTKTQMLDLKQRQEHLQKTIQEMEGEPPPLVTSSMERLGELLEKAEPILRTALPSEEHDLAHAR